MVTLARAFSKVSAAVLHRWCLFPEPMQTVAKVLPLTWATKLSRVTWTESVDGNETGVAVLVSTTLLRSTLAIWFFRWD